MSELSVLTDLIVNLRDELEAELPIRLHARNPSVTMDDEHEPEATFGHMTGLPFTAAFTRFLGSREHYGYEFLGAQSIEEVWAFCRMNHDESHLEPQPTGSLCKRLVVAIVELRQPIAFVAAGEGIGIFATRKHLLAVLDHAKEWREGRKVAAVIHDTEDLPSPDPIGDMLTRQHQEAREQAVWERLRIRHPYLSGWEDERKRREGQHRKLGCPRCMTAIAA